MPLRKCSKIEIVNYDALTSFKRLVSRKCDVNLGVYIINTATRKRKHRIQEMVLFVLIKTATIWYKKKAVQCYQSRPTQFFNDFQYQMEEMMFNFSFQLKWEYFRQKNC